MEIRDERNKNWQFIYFDANSFDGLPYEQCRQHLGVCFYGDKVVLGWHEGKHNHWSLVGGTIEPGEFIDSALIREVQEESNMKVLWHKPIGYQQVTTADGKVFFQLRSYCEVEPIGDFVSDPAGIVTRITYIEPNDFKNFVDWGEIGNRIIERAVEIHKLHKQ